MHCVCRHLPRTQCRLSQQMRRWLQNGPVEYTLNGTLKQRAITWNAEYSMLYFDSPVGAGFSFTNSSAGYTTTEDQVAAQLYNALTQVRCRATQLSWCGVVPLAMGESWC